VALQAIKHGIPFPPWPSGVSQQPSQSLILIDAASEKAAIVFAATAAKNIHKVHLRTSTVTTGDTVDVRVETVDTAANGDPTGTLWATNTNASLVIAGSDDNVWKEATLTADATVAIGDIVSIVVANGGGGGNMNLVSYADMTASFPYGDHFTASWAKLANCPLIIPEYSDGSFEPIYGMAENGAINARTFKSDDATNRRGNIFQVAFPSRAKGAWAWVDGDAAFTIKLYDAAGTSELATTAATNAFQRSAATPGLYFLPFTSSVNLSKDTNYRVAVVPSAASNIVAYDFDVPAAGMLDMFPGGQNCHRSVYTSSAWVETTTSRAYVGVMLDAFDDGVGGGGGGILLPNKRGGKQ
jgi:hypothetical protein